MAAVTRTDLEGNSYLYTWAALTAADPTGDAIKIPGAADRTVQIAGTFSAGAVSMQGSLDGVTYFNLTDPQGNEITKSDNALEQIMENVAYLKPVIAGADGSDSVVVQLLARGTMR